VSAMHCLLNHHGIPGNMCDQGLTYSNRQLLRTTVVGWATLWSGVAQEAAICIQGLAYLRAQLCEQLFVVTCLLQ
jgi:hypothetical protein